MLMLMSYEVDHNNSVDLIVQSSTWCLIIRRGKNHGKVVGRFGASSCNLKEHYDKVAL